MSGAVDETVLADILETAGQRAEEIRVEIASLKEKTGNNAVTVPQLLKGDAIPDVTEPAEATRLDEPDASLQFTVSTPSGERQAPPKTEDGTDTEDLERVHAALNSPIQVYVRSSNNLAAGRQPDAAGWPSAAGDAACTGVSDASGEAQGESGSWQGLYQGMLGKLNKSQATEQQCASSVAAILRSAGMASAVDSANCNARPQLLTTPFAHDCSQAAAVAAGAITSQPLEAEAATAAAAILPSPVHVVDGSYTAAEGETAAAVAAADPASATVKDADATEQWGPTWSVHSPSKPGTGRRIGSAGGVDCQHADGSSSSAGGADGTGTVTPQRLVVPASAADLPVQAVLDELDELLSWSSKTPTHHHQQQQHQGLGFSRSDKLQGTEGQAHQQHGNLEQQTGAGGMAADVTAAAAAAGSAASGGDDEEDWVLRWLRSQKGHMSRCNSTSCLLSDEYMQRSGRSSSSSNNSRMRRSCSLPTEPLSRASVSAGGLEAAAAAGVVDEEGAGKHHKQQQHDADIKDEILAHLRLAAAFRPRPRESPNSSSLPRPCTPPAAASGAPTAAAKQPAATTPAAACPPNSAGGAAGEAMQHGVSLVDWVGKYIGAQPASAAPTGSSLDDIDESEARLQLLCGGILGDAAAAEAADGCGKPGSSSSSVAAAGLEQSKPAVGTAAKDYAAAVAGGAGEAASAPAVPASPKAISKSAQLYQQLLLRSHGSLPGSPPKSSSGGGSSSAGRSRQGSSSSRGGGSHSQAGSATQQGRGSRSPVKSSASTSAGGAPQQQQQQQQVSGSVAGGTWPSPDAAVQRAVSPGKQWLELQLPEGQTEQEAAGCSSVTCTTCGSPVLCGRAGTAAQHTRMSIMDLTAEIAAEEAAAGGESAAQDGCNSATPAADAVAAALAGDGTADTQAAAVGSHNDAVSASHASISVAALMAGGAVDDGLGSFAGAPGCSSISLASPGAAVSPVKTGSPGVLRSGGSAPATPKGSNRKSKQQQQQQQQPAGYAAQRRQSGYAASASGRHSNAMRMSYAAAGRPSGYAGAAAEREGRLGRAGTASLPGAAAAGQGRAAPEEVPAVTTAISCGQLLAAAALERALGRVSAGGAAAAAAGSGPAAHAAEVDDEQLLEQELQLSGCKVAADGQQQQKEAGNADRPSLSGLLELERDMEEAALEDELATLQPGSSTAAAAAAAQKQQMAPNVFVYRLQPTNEPGSSSSGGAGPAGGAGAHSTTTAAAAAAAALQTLAACASRKVPRCASVSPRRLSTTVSPSRMSSSKQTSAGASKRSSSTDAPTRGSAGVSRTSSSKSSAVGFGSSSSRDGSSSAGSSRVWRPGGRRTSAKDDCRKLQDYESARSRILGPVSEAGTAGGSGDVHDSKGGGRPSPKPSAFGRSNSPAKKPGRAGAAAAAAAAAEESEGSPAASAMPVSRGRVTTMTSAAAAPTSKSARAAARGTPPKSPVAASRAAAAATARAAAAARTPPALRSRPTAAPKMQEQGVQADIRPPRIEVGTLPHVPHLLDTGSLLDELSRKSKRPARHSTPGRLQAAPRFPPLLLPGQQQQQQSQLVKQRRQDGTSSPTTSQVEEAIKAAQVALLQRRWQISQLRKTMAQHGITSTAGMRSRSSSVQHSSLLSSIMRHESQGMGAVAGIVGTLGAAGYATHSGSTGRRQGGFSYDSLGAATGSRSQPLTPAAAVPAQQGFSREEEVAAAGEADDGAVIVSSYASQAASVAALIKHYSSSAADAAGPDSQQQQRSIASRSPSPGRQQAAAAAAVPAAAKYRSASAFDGVARLCSEEPDMPLRPSSAQAVFMKAAAAAAAAAAAEDQQHYTATIFASPATQQQPAAAAALTASAAQPGSELGSRRSSCSKEVSPLRRRSSVGSPAAAGGSAAAGSGSAASPPWSAPRGVSSSGLTGEELMAYYRRSSAAEAAEAAAEAAAAAGEVPAAGLQLDVLLRAFNALARRKNTVDKSAALAALMDQIVAVANQAAAAKQAAAASTTGAEPLAGMDARQLTMDSEGSKLDVLGRSVVSSPQPTDAVSGRGSPGIAGGCVLQVRKGDMRAGWQSACAERQAAHDSLLSTPRHKRPASAGYAADLAALGNAQGGQQQLEEQAEGEETAAGLADGMSPTHAMLMHTAARLGEFAGDAHGSCAGIPPEALAAAAPYGNGVVVVRMSTTETSGRLPMLRDTPAGRAVLAGIDGTSLTVQQAVHWLKVGLTRLPSSSEAGMQGSGQRQPTAQRGSRVASPQSPSRRARSRPCSPFRACFTSSAALSSEEEEEAERVILQHDLEKQLQQQQQQQQQRQQEGVHFEMDDSSQLVMVVPQSLAMGPQEGMQGQQQQQQLGGCGVHKCTVTGVALPADEGCQPGVSSSGAHCLELITSAGRHRIELASKRDFAGLLAGLNAMLLLKEAGADAAEKLGALPIEDTAWAGGVEGWQGAA